MQYPSNWTVIESEYNPATNNTVVGFFAQSKTASELGNISGVSGLFHIWISMSLILRICL
jgi:hypothetical protein